MYLETCNNATKSISYLLDESSLAGAVLTNHHHKRFTIEVRIIQLGRVEVMEVVLCLHWQQIVFVDLLESRGDILKHGGWRCLFTKHSKFTTSVICK